VIWEITQLGGIAVLQIACQLEQAQATDAFLSARSTPVTSHLLPQSIVSTNHNRTNQPKDRKADNFLRIHKTESKVLYSMELSIVILTSFRLFLDRKM